jgi:plasmid stabilization system protein ParE
LKRFEIVLLQGAQSDLLGIYAMRGERTYLAVDQAFGILRVFPEAGPLNFGGKIRRLVVTKTHFGIFYTISGQRVLVGAVLDLRASPEAIEQRLREL